MENSVQKKLFNHASQYSPVIPTYDLVRQYDESGNTVIIWKEVNGDELIRSLGDVNMWSLDAMLKAGINPESMHIHTGYNTRLEGINDLNSVVSEVEATFNNNEEKNNE